ncbi:MAG TPA: RDD family protein [Candidatus Moranbacteria bacterium]|nr:RDD family protein [Candidatus Moranbacteria bacterium]
MSEQNLRSSVEEAAFPATNTRYGGFWIRFLASFLDYIILSLGLSFLSFFLAFPMGVSFLWGMLIEFVYTAVFWRYYSATPGKMILGLQIVKKDGTPIGWREIVIRYLGYFVSMIALGLGFLHIAFSARKQGWHDLMAGTYVIRKN